MTRPEAKTPPEVNGEPLRAVRGYIDAFNAGDVDAMANACTATMSILDGMPPHVWHGPNATRHWHRDVLDEGLRHGASGYHVTLGEPHHVDVAGDAAYVVLPATMTFDASGVARTQDGAVFTVALRREAHSWLVAAWAWAKGR